MQLLRYETVVNFSLSTAVTIRKIIKAYLRRRSLVMVALNLSQKSSIKQCPGYFFIYSYKYYKLVMHYSTIKALILLNSHGGSFRRNKENSISPPHAVSTCYIV
jgi:hypothetical protein